MSNKSKIFIIVFNKSGTRTLHNFFLKNNILSIHWDEGKLADTIEYNFKNGKKLLLEYDNYKVFSDMENYKTLNFAHITYFKDLDKQYPLSKFILNIRNVDNWIKSRNNHWDGKYCNDLCNILDCSKFDLNNKWKEDYFDHIKNVKEYFKNTNKLLVFDIENDSVNKLVHFFPELKLNTEYYTHCGKTIC